MLFVWEMLEVSLEDNVFHTHGSPGRRLLTPSHCFSSLLSVEAKSNHLHEQTGGLIEKKEKIRGVHQEDQL